MNVPLLIAAVLAVILGIGHSYLGERSILGRLFRRGNLPELFRDPEQTKRVIRLAWHVMSLFALGLAAILVALALRPAETRTIAAILSLTFALCGLASLILARGRHVSWVIFVSIAALTWAA